MKAKSVIGKMCNFLNACGGVDVLKKNARILKCRDMPIFLFRR